MAAVISVRRAALFTAILGIAGGLATPILVSTGSDRPVALFSYLALLNVGFLWVARRQAWAIVAGLALGGTTLLEIGWMATRLTEEKLAIGITAFAVLGGLYLWHALQTHEDDPPTSHGLGLIGASLPFVLALILAGDARYTEKWPLVLGYLAVIDLAAMAAGLWRLRIMVPISAGATALAFVLWPLVNREAAVAPGGPTLVVLALTAAYNVLGRLAASRGETHERPALSAFGVSGLVVAARPLPLHPGGHGVGTAAGRRSCSQ